MDRNNDAEKPVENTVNKAPEAPSEQNNAVTKPPDASAPQKKPTARSRRNMLIYATAFACVVILLITISYFMQLKENRELAGNLQEQITVSQGASENIKKLQAEYEKLSAEKAELEKQLEEKTIELNNQNETIAGLEQTISENEDALKSSEDRQALLEKKYYAYTDMTELLRLTRSGDLEGARNVLAIMEQREERASIDTMSQAVYDQLKTELGIAQSR